MNLAETLRIAWDALVANKMRSILTMLGIIIGVGSVIAVIAIGQGTRAAVLNELEGFGGGLIEIFPGSGMPGQTLERTELFTERDMEMLKGLLPEVAEASTILPMAATIRYESTTMQTSSIIGAYAGTPQLMNLKVGEGRWFTEDEEVSGARLMVLSADAVTKLFGDGATDVIGKTVSVNGYPFQVIGVLQKETGLLTNMMGFQDTSFYVPASFVKRVTGQTEIPFLLLKARPGADPEVVLQDAIALLERSHDGARYSGVTFAQVTASISSITSILTGLIAAIAAISLVVGGVGIMNIMLVSVTERTREIGLRKAIGATYSNILVQFLIEAVVLCVVGGALGVGFAAVPVWLAGRAMGIPLAINLTSVILALAFSAGVGILFGVYPASKAARLDPIEALRYE